MLLLRTHLPGTEPATALLRWRRPILLLAGIFAACVLYWEITRFVAYTGDAYVTSDLVAVAPQVSGRIVGVHVRDNQTVRRGDRLVTIDRVPFELAVAALRAALVASNARAAADRDIAAAAQGTRDAVLATLEFAQDSRRRISDLAAYGDVSRQNLDAADEALRQAQAGADSAKSRFAGAQQIVAIDESAAARVSVELALAEWRLSRTDMLAPADGTISHLTVRVGDTAREDAPLIGIIDAGAWRIIANYKQDYLRASHPGSTGWVWLDSTPWHWHRARIEGVGILGGSLAPRPYAWLLGGITADMVMMGVLADPAHGDTIALKRSVEIAVGAIAALCIALLFAASGAAAETPAAPGWSTMFGPHRYVLNHALRTGIAVMLVPVAWDWFALPGLSQMAISVAAVMTVPGLAANPDQAEALMRQHALHRIVGCMLGGSAGVMVLAAGANALLPWLAALFAGVWIGSYLQTSTRQIGYVGVQATVAFILTQVQGWGPPTSLTPEVERLVGVLLGVGLLLVVSVGWPAPRPMPGR